MPLDNAVGLECGQIIGIYFAQDNSIPYKAKGVDAFPTHWFHHFRQGYTDCRVVGQEKYVRRHFQNGPVRPSEADRSLVARFFRPSSLTTFS